MEVGRLMMERAARTAGRSTSSARAPTSTTSRRPVWAITTRGEIYSAYTPYQAEASQGTLQAIYEYQTMIASLTGMQVSNASLYDGASALAEAALMAVRAPPQVEVLARSSCRARSIPQLPQACARAPPPATRASPSRNCRTSRRAAARLLEALAPYEGQDITAIAIQQPNFFGQLEEVDELVGWARANGALVIAVVNPTSLALLKPPGEWGEGGVDIACGEGQPLGVPLSSGGPYFGFMTTRMEHVRQMPGRIVGRTVDLDGRPGFTLTLQAREQHIRRGKATSNICTNQGLLMTAATIYMTLLGPAGLERVAAASMANTRRLVEALARVKGVRTAFEGARFHEAVLQLDRPVRGVLETLAARGIVGGHDLGRDYPELGNALLVCATETRTQADIDQYAAALGEALASARAA
jgi:glycine dehydrogenase subunit 1